MMDSSGLLLNNQNPDIDQRHYIKQGPVLIDLTQLDSDTLIAPRETGRKLFVVKTTDSLQLYADFDDFVMALIDELNGAPRRISKKAPTCFHVGAEPIFPESRGRKSGITS